MYKQLHYHQYHKPVAKLFFLIWLLSLFLLPSTASASDDSQYFPETGITVSGKFLSYWRDNGGLPVFGYPITEAQNEVDPETGKTFLTQWFERNRFELHPENAGTRFEVLLGLLGKDLQRDAIVADASFQHTSSKAGATYFPETGHNLEGAFLYYWQANGGLARFGYPISEPRSEGSYETGKLLWTQWFERARFEYHPLNKAPYDVLLGLLGNQIKTHPPVKNGESHVVWEKKANQNLLLTPKIKSVDSEGNLYLINTAVVTENSTSIKREFAASYDQKGNFIRQFTDPAADSVGAYGLYDFTADQQGNSYALLPLAGSPGYKIKVFNKNGELTSNWSTTTPSLFRSITADNVGNIYVADDRSVKKYDKLGNLLVTLLEYTASSSSLYVQQVAVDKQNNAYITLLDTNQNKLYKYDSQGKLLYQRDLNMPDDPRIVNDLLAIDNSGNILISNYNAGYIAKFSPQGDFLAKINGPAPQENLNNFNGIAVDSQDNIYLTSYNRSYVLKLDNNGKFISRIGESSATDVKCYGRAVLANNQLFALDPYYGKVVRIGTDGQHIGNVTLQGDNPADKIFTANQKVYVAQGPQIFRYTGEGKPDGELNTSSVYVLAVVDLAIDKQEKVYAIYYNYKQPISLNNLFFRSVASPVVDMEGHLYVIGQFISNTNDVFAGLDNTPQILKYDTSNLQLSSLLSKYGSADEEFLSGVLAVDPQNRLYMLDGTLGRVQQFDRNGKLLAKWFDPRLKSVTSFQVDGQGNLYGVRGCDLVKFTLN